MQTNQYAVEETKNSPKASQGFLVSLLAWSGYWFCAWIGTTIAGGVFGLLLGFFANADRMSESLIAGLLFGLVWSGFVGAVVIPHIAIAVWMFWFNRSDPGYSGAFAGGLVGAICGIIFLPITTPMGWVGAFYACRLYTGTEFGQRVRNNDFEPWRFSMRDLFLRMTVIAILLGFWVGVAQQNRRPNRIASEQTSRRLPQVLVKPRGPSKLARML